MATTTIQSIFEMRKNGQFEEAYEAILPLYREHHGYYTTLCMFWTATDVMRLRIEAGRCAEAEQIFASLRGLYASLQDKDNTAAHTLTRLALLLATKEQDLAKLAMYPDNSSTGKSLSWEINPTELTFSLLDYMTDFGTCTLRDEDWQANEWNGHIVPSFAGRIISRVFHEVNELDDCNIDRLQMALDLVQLGLQRTPRNRHLLRYEANLTYRMGDNDRAIRLYRHLVGHYNDSYLFSELAAMVDDYVEQAALLSKAIMNQRSEAFAQKDRLTLATLLKEQYPQNAAFELAQVMQLRDSLGQRPNRTIIALQKDLEEVTPVTSADQHEFYQRLLQKRPICA